jgi:serine/threonine protein kinase
LTTLDPDTADIKLADFGLARDNRKDKSLSKNIGTPYYQAPEMSGQGEYCHKVDVYSLGLVFFEIFEGRGLVNYDFISNGDKYKMKNFGCVFTDRTPPAARSLISRMTAVRPEERISIEQAAKDPFFVSGAPGDI